MADFITAKYEEYQVKLKWEPSSSFSPTRMDVSSSPVRPETPVELSPFSVAYTPNKSEKLEISLRCPVHPTNLYAGYNYTKFLLALSCMANNISLHLLNLYLPYSVNWCDMLRSLLPVASSIPKPLPEFVGYGDSITISNSIETSTTSIKYRVVESLEDVVKIRRSEDIYIYFHTGPSIIENKYNVNINLNAKFSIDEFHIAVEKFRRSIHFREITALLGSTVLIGKNSPVAKFLQFIFDDLKYIVYRGKLYHANYMNLKNFFSPRDYFVIRLFDGRILTVKTYISYSRYCDLPRVLTEYY